MHSSISKIARRITEKGYEAIVCCSPDNVAYSAGFMVPSHPRNRHRHALSVITADGSSCMVVVTVEEGVTRDNACIKDVRGYNEFTEEPMRVLAEILNEKGATGLVALETSYLFAEDYLALTRLMPRTKWVNCEELMSEIRAVKTPEDIEAIRGGARVADRVYDRIRREAAPSMTEIDLYRLAMEEMVSCGVEYPRMVIGSGPRAAYANAKPTDRKISKGELVRFDVLGLYKDYQIDVARTAVVGEPSREQRDTWAALVRIHESAIGRIGPGVSTKQVFLEYAREMKEAGVPATLNFLGHGLGLSVHEQPYFNRYSDVILKEDMVLCVEPIYLIPGYGGYHVEDEIRVTSDGAEVLSRLEDARELIRIGK